MPLLYNNDKTFKFSEIAHENEFEKKESPFKYKTPIKNLKEEEIQNRENHNFFKKSPIKIKQEEDPDFINKNESLAEENDNKLEIEEMLGEEQTKPKKQTVEIFDDIIKNKSNFDLENLSSRPKNNFGIFNIFLA